MYRIPLWSAGFHQNMMQKLFDLNKKCVRIVCRKTQKIDLKLQNTKPKFFRLKLMTVFNLFTRCIAKWLVNEEIPVDIHDRFNIFSR